MDIVTATLDADGIEYVVTQDVTDLIGMADDGDDAGLIEYMWTEGNYSCDCNKRLFISRQHEGVFPGEDEKDIMEHVCGRKIKLKKLTAEIGGKTYELETER